MQDVDINLLNIAMQKLHVIDISRREIGGLGSNCIPIQKSDELLLIHYFVDFYYDGFKIIRNIDISEIERGASQLFYENILQKEGIYNKLKAPKINLISDWASVLTELSMKYIYFIIECENSEDVFHIGKVQKQLDRHVEFLEFDALGNWNDVTTKIKYSDITCISFDDGYTNTITKYIQNK